jgi:hypothetical protein
MRIRIAITIIALCLYVGLFNVYIHEVTRIDPHYSKLFYDWLTIGAISFFLIDIKCGFVNYHHKQFNLLLILSVIINNVLRLLTHFGTLRDDKPEQMYYSFNLSVFSITLTIFICGWKYKTFRD